MWKWFPIPIIKTGGKYDDFSFYSFGYWFDWIYF